MEQERKVGAWFTVSLWVECDMSSAIACDSLDGTVDYADLYNIIRREMSVSSQLLEHVAGRISNSVFAAFPSVLSIRVQLVKENPPFGANLHGAGVDIIFPRQ